MKKLVFLGLSFILVVMFQSCASIFSASKYPVQLQSTPDRADVVITDRNGVSVFNGQTPAVVTLKAKSGFMKKAIYNIKFSKKGYSSKTYSISASLDGWYWANLLLGGVVGMLIVDPASGAMFQIDKNFIDATLSKESLSLKEKKSNELRVYDISEIPEEWKKHLVEINKINK